MKQAIKHLERWSVVYFIFGIYSGLIIGIIYIALLIPKH